MILVLDPAAQRASLADADNFRQLHAQLPVAGEPGGALAEIARLDNDGLHLWVRVARLRELGPATQAWQQRFDAMIDYARGKGWVDAAGTMVRVHIERSPAGAS
jgi:hypothetical protein